MAPNPKLIDSGFDLISERGTKLEVKDDYASRRTGNVAIEFESNGKPSGIAVTTASHWIIGTADYSYLARVTDLRGLEGSVVSGGFGKRSRMKLITIEQLQSISLRQHKRTQTKAYRDMSVDELLGIFEGDDASTQPKEKRNAA